ncbi:MAG: hypothetical protein ACTSSG_08975 [Candidatus Heimdallarchaeaceae archaeon]
MTILGSHLVCDCQKAIKSARCPKPMLSPITKRISSYYHCPTCHYDYLCSQAIKDITEKDKYGFPLTEKKVCRKCETKLEKRSWPE